MLVINKISTTVSTFLILGVLSFASTTSAGPLQSHLLKVADNKASGEYVRARFVTALKTPIHPNAKKKALIIGDSHSQDFFNAVLENNYLRNYQIKTRYIPTRCQIYLGKKTEQYILPKDKGLCVKSDNLSKAKQAIANSDLIILVSKWRKWSAKELPQTIRNMKLTAKQKLIVVGSKSFGKINIRKYLRLPENKLRSLRNNIDGHQNEINEILRKSIKSTIFVNTQQLICGSSNTCPVFTPDLKLISFDGGHLTKDGAQYVGEKLFKNPILAVLK